MNARIRPATPADVPAITRVVNAAYVVEQEFKATGLRTDEADVANHLNSGQFLVLEGEEGSIAGCVYVESDGTHGYFGMLSVEPALQGQGLGKILVEAAEEACLAAGCSDLSIWVVDRRKVLFPWYGKLGYVESGREPFPQPERLTMPVEMVVMTKQLSPVRATGGRNDG